MNFHQILQHVKTDSLASVGAYGPELALIAAVLLLLLLRVPRWTRSFPSLIVALIGSGAAFVLALAECVQAEAGSLSTLGEPIFTGLLVHDNLSICFRMLLTGFAFLLLILTWLTKMPDAENAPDVYAMILGSVIGMCIMASANNMLMVFFGIEMASVPSYVLAGTIKGRKVASEAALKFAVYGAGTAGVMLYGISLVSGALGTLHLPTMAEQLAQVLADGGDKQLVLFLGGLMIMVGFAFKLSAVPFHFWCPDVFEGATAEVNAFLSVASKAAALALLIRVACGLGGESLVHDAPHNPPVETTAATAAAEPVVILVASETNRDSAAGESAATISKVEALRPARDYIVFVISLLAGLSATFGNLAAYGQTNIKRLLAYSTIAHAGYMMMAAAAAVQLIGAADPDRARGAVASLVVYVTTYLFMSLGAFAVVAFLRNELRSEEIKDYAGLIHQCPGLVVCMGIILFSLIGLPPFAGFVAKFSIFASLYDAGLHTLLLVGALNTVVSLFYYLRVIKVMTIDPEPEERPPVSLGLFSGPGGYVLLVTLPVALGILGWDGLREWSIAAASNLFQ